MCVLPTGRSFLIVLDLRHASWPLRKGCLLSFQHYRSRTRSSCRKEWPSQTLWLLLMTHMTALSSPTRLNTSSLQTLSDQEMLETFLQSHRHLTALRLQRPRFDSIQKSTPDDSLYNSLLQAKAATKALLSSSFLFLVNVFFARAVLGDNYIACNF